MKKDALVNKAWEVVLSSYSGRHGELKKWMEILRGEEETRQCGMSLGGKNGGANLLNVTQVTGARGMDIEAAGWTS